MCLRYYVYSTYEEYIIYVNTMSKSGIIELEHKNKVRFAWLLSGFVSFYSSLVLRITNTDEFVRPVFYDLKNVQNNATDDVV